MTTVMAAVIPRQTRVPRRTRSYWRAPKFCPAKVVMEIPSELTVIQNRKSILLYTPQAATAVVPNPLMDAWIMMLEMLYSADGAALGRPMRQISRRTAQSIERENASRCQGIPLEPARQRRVSTALATWLITVAMAAPATPQWKPATNS